MNANSYFMVLAVLLLVVGVIGSFSSFKKVISPCYDKYGSLIIGSSCVKNSVNPIYTTIIGLAVFSIFWAAFFQVVESLRGDS